MRRAKKKRTVPLAKILLLQPGHLETRPLDNLPVFGISIGYSWITLSHGVELEVYPVLIFYDFKTNKWTLGFLRKSQGIYGISFHNSCPSQP